MTLPLASAVVAACLAAPAFAEGNAPAGSPDFVKGELSQLGATKLQTQNTRVGLRLGTSKIGAAYYLAGALEFDLAWDDLKVGLAAPVRVALWDPAAPGGLKHQFLPEGLKLRREDYDELSELMRVVRVVRWGGKEQALFVNLSTESATTIGHGGSVRRYLANVDVDRGRLSAELDAYGRYGGAELFVGDVLRPDRMVAALVFLKPFGGAKSLVLERLSVGATYAADFRAPYRLKRDEAGLPVLPADADETTKTPIVEEERAAQLVGVSIETKLVKTESMDLKPYVEANMLVGGGSGLALGALGRFSFGGGTHAFRTIAEARAFDGNYVPGYFDTFYEVQKFQFITGSANAATDLPKLADVLGRSSERKLGYYLEAQYALEDTIALTAAWEDSQAKGGRNLVVHAEIPAWERLRFFASAHRRSVEGGLFEIGTQPAKEQLKADNTLFFAGARLKILPILYLNARAFRAWKMDEAARSYRNVEGFEVDLEAGYEFSRD